MGECGAVKMKRFFIEFRIKNPTNDYLSNIRFRKRYKTEKQRDQALRDLNRKGDCFEYRKVDIKKEGQ